MKATFRWQTLTSTISTTFVLVLLGLTILCALTAQHLSNNVKESLTVTVVLTDSATDSTASVLQKNLLQRPWTQSVTYISSEQALKEQTEAMGTDPTEFLGDNPFAALIELNLKADYACTDSLLWISKRLKAYPLVADVMYQKDIVERLNTNLHRASYVLLGLAALLMLITLVLINNTVRLSVYSRRFVIHTMKLVGASWSFIMRPFLTRSLWIGLASASIACLAIGGGVYWLVSTDPSLAELLPRENLLVTGAAVLCGGLVITLLCTYVSVSHYLSMRENDLYG